MNRAALGRADLIRWAATLDDARLERLAGQLGYVEEDAPDRDGTLLRSEPSVSVAGTKDLLTGEARAHPQRHFALTQRRRLTPPPDAPAPVPAPLPETPVDRLGPPPPLVPWPRLWPFLRAALGEDAERHRVDLPRLVRACARVRPPRRLPRLKGRRWAGSARVIIDTSPRLYPF